MKRERVLITGALGFVGKHMTALALTKGVEVHGLEIIAPPGSPAGNVKIHKCDLCDASAVKKIVNKVRPSKIFHLAAQSSVSYSWKDARKTFKVNINGQLNLFDAVLAAKIKPVIVVACSADEYGNPGKNSRRINETTPLAPGSPYAISKAAQDLLAEQYHLEKGLKTVRIRAFNHTGPGRGENFAESSFAKQIALIEAGKQKPVISVGNLSPVRDFTDVRDFVAAYWAASEKCRYGEVYNVSSGKGISIKAILEQLLSRSCAKVKVIVDKNKFRPADIQMLVGDSTKFRKKTGWEQVIPLEKSLTDLLEFWRWKVG